MVHRGSFHGLRKEFLLSVKPDYAAGVDGGFAGDALAIIQRRYFKRFPVELPDEEEPTSEHLEAVDDDKPEPEQQVPDIDLLGEDGFAAAMKKIDKRRELVTFRKAQIKRWLAYQFMKDHDLDPKDSGASNPYRILLYQLTGVKISRPRLKSPANVWRKTQRGIIDEEVARRMGIITTNNSRRKDLISTRDLVAREMYNKLPEVEKVGWIEQAQEEHKAALEAWQEDLKKKPSTEPVARQKCIQGLTRFVQPILNSIVEATGWKVSLLAGGPEPADQGRLNIISIHSGSTTGDVPMNFGRAERVRYKKYVVPAFGSFLQKCYTVEECRSRALPESKGYPTLATLDLEEEGVDFDPVPSAESLVTLEQRKSNSVPSSAPPGSIPPPSYSSGLHLQTTPPLDVPDSSNQDFHAHRQLSQPPSQRHPSVPRFTPLLDSRPSSPSNSSASSDQPPPSSICSSDSTSANSSSSRMVISPTTSLSSGSALSIPSSEHSSTNSSSSHVVPFPPTSLSSGNIPSSLSLKDMASTTSISPNAVPSPPMYLSSSDVRPAPSSEDALADSHPGSSLPTSLSLPGAVLAPASTLNADAPPMSSSHGTMTGPASSYVASSPSMLPIRSTVVSEAPRPSIINPSSTSSCDASVALEVPGASLQPSTYNNLDREQRTEQGSKRARTASADGSKEPGPSPKRPRLSNTTLRSHRNSSRRLPSTANVHETLSPSNPPLAASSSAQKSPSASSDDNLDLPNWFKEAKSMFEAEPLGEQWLELVRLWSLFEKLGEYTGVANMPSKNRPQAVAQWIKRKRAPTWRPTINLTSYEEDFREWWTSLQPAWRIQDGAIVLANVEGDWGVLKRPGINGFVSILSAVFFWGCHIVDVGENMDMWSLVVKDCIQALSHLVDSMST